jgi:hypothetical protein
MNKQIFFLSSVSLIKSNSVIELLVIVVYNHNNKNRQYSKKNYIINHSNPKKYIKDHE